MSLTSSTICGSTSVTHTISEYQRYLGGPRPHYWPPHAHALATQSPSGPSLSARTQNVLIRPLFHFKSLFKTIFLGTRILFGKHLRAHAALWRPPHVQGLLHTWGLYKPRVCVGASEKGPQITVKMDFFYKTSVNNETRMSLRHTWLWRCWNQRSESLKRQSWPRKEKVPLLCSATENDTNEVPGSYLSAQMCHLWHFFLYIVQNCRLFFFLYPDHFYSSIQSFGTGKHLWSSFFEIFGFSNIEKRSKQFFFPFSCLWPWLIKRIHWA